MRLKALLKPVARQLGILRWRDRRARAHHNRQIERDYPQRFFSTEICGRELHFRTEGAREKVWFHSRYKPGDLHERSATEELLKRIRESDSFLDVGSYFGWYSCVAAVAAPQGRVLALELDKDNFAVLGYNIALNKLWNVETIQVAAFDSDGEVRVQASLDSISPEHAVATRPDEGQVTVRSVVLDDLISGKGFRPDFVKIDVEGAETAVLRGLRESLQRWHPTLFVEVHRDKLIDFGSSTKELVTLLTGLGYRIEVFTDHRSAGSLADLTEGYIFGDNEMVVATPH